MTAVFMRATLGVALATAMAAASCDMPVAQGQEQSLRQGSPVAACFLAAKAQTGLLDAQIFELCRGTSSAQGPVQCVTAAEERLFMTSAARINLCQCADSAEPVDCWATLSDRTTLLDAQIENLCAPRVANRLLPGCIPATTVDQAGY